MLVPIEASGLQNTVDIQKEGLPFWIFWFLLCVILLLVVFIFLRDKDLRLRISAFLSGAKRSLLRLRLQAKVRKEKEKKNGIWKELGRRAWSENVRVDGTDELRLRLQSLDEEIRVNQGKWQDVFSRIEALNRELQEARRKAEADLQALEASRRPFAERADALEARSREVSREVERLKKEAAALDRQAEAFREESASLRAQEPRTDERAARAARAEERLLEVQARRAAIDSALPPLEHELSLLANEEPDVRARLEESDRSRDEIQRAVHEKAHDIEKKIRRWDGAKRKIQDRILRLKEEEEPLYESLGESADRARCESAGLAPFYRQIDAVNAAITDLMTRIANLQ